MPPCPFKNILWSLARGKHRAQTGFKHARLPRKPRRPPPHPPPPPPSVDKVSSCEIYWLLPATSSAVRTSTAPPRAAAAFLAASNCPVNTCTAAAFVRSRGSASNFRRWRRSWCHPPPPHPPGDKLSSCQELQPTPVNNLSSYDIYSAPQSSFSALHSNLDTSFRNFHRHRVGPEPRQGVRRIVLHEAIRPTARVVCTPRGHRWFLCSPGRFALAPRAGGLAL